MQNFKKFNLIAIFLSIELLCFCQPCYARTRTILNAALPPGENQIGRIILTGVAGDDSTIDADGRLNVDAGTFNTLVLNRYLANFHDHDTTLSVAATFGDTEISIQAADYASFAVNDRLFISAGGPIEENHYPIITAKPGSPVLTLNKPLDFSYPIGSVVSHVVINMASQAGSLADPIIYKLQPPQGVTFNVTGLIAVFQMASAGDYSKFGDVTGGFTNGIVSRARVNGIIRTRSAYRTNSDIEDDASEPLVFHDKAGSGDFGMVATYFFGTFGAYIPINGSGAGGGDFFEVLVQDDPTDLVFVRAKIHGYVTVN